jgi:enediyne biosynthesis protein E4
VGPDAPPRPYTAEEGWQTMQIWGMGIASHDLTGDGLPEVYLTSQGDNKLQSLDSGGAAPHYGDIAYERGATAHRPFVGDTTRPSTGWHAEFQDVNNDGYVDLFVAKGNVEAMPEYAADDPNNLLIGGSDGVFTEGAAEAGIVSFARSRGAALADLDLDGMLDLVVVNRREPAQLWRNVGRGDAGAPVPVGGWVDIRLEQAGANRHAVGAWIEVRVGSHSIERELTIGGGHAGGQLGWMHFGLGEATHAEVRIRWPDGEQGGWSTVATGERVVIERGTVEPRRWSAPAG